MLTYKPSLRSHLDSVVAAYTLGLLYGCTPKLLATILRVVRGREQASIALRKILLTLRQASSISGFATFCGTLIGLSAALRALLESICERIEGLQGRDGQRSLVPPVRPLLLFAAHFLAAAVSFTLFNSKRQDRQDQTTSDQDINALAPKLGIPPLPEGCSLESGHDQYQLAGSGEPSRYGKELAGRSMDLTLLAVIQAADVLTSFSVANASPSRFGARVSKWTTPALFALASATIMDAFFYAPDRLPRSYRTWIARAAKLDDRLLYALRQARYGHFVYGEETGIGPLLGSLSKEYGLPVECGNPAQTIPVPCELVHNGLGPSCEKHVLFQFAQGFGFAMSAYLPIHVLAAFRRSGWKQAPRSRALQQAVVASARSSSFLGAFIALFYLGVCLARNRIGPFIYDQKRITPQTIDGGLCVLAGCVLCGWSILVEQPAKRLEILLFVLPRAMAVWFPRRYPKEFQWREQLAFSLSIATVFTAVQERPERVRGMLGRALCGVLRKT